MNLANHIEKQRVDRNPSEAQKEAGNYRKAHIRIHGLDITIENPCGSYRNGVGDDGKPWRCRLPAHYGYIKRTEGSDGDHVDVYIGPHHKSPKVYVIDQHDLKSGKYDEHKVMLGFASKGQAKETYHRTFSDGKGKDRIGHIEAMTVDEFKDWLRNGDTTAPIKHRAEGGRVHMADGGTPVTDPDVLAQLNAPAPVTDPALLAQLNAPTPTVPDQGSLSALGHGAASGATFGFSDELRGVHAAAPDYVPEMVGPVPAKMMAGAARLAKNYLMGNDPEALTAYEKSRDEERQAQASGKANHPYVYGSGEIAAAIPAMAAMPELAGVRGAGLGANMVRGAVAGGEYGALSGAGEGDDLASRATNAASGLAGGIVGGAVAPVAGKVLEAGYNRFIQPGVSAIRGLMNPEAEAGRRLATALQKDQEMIAVGTAKGMSPQEWAAARQAGEPVTLADLGAGNTQALLRSAANTSPEGRAMLEKVMEDRFLGQGERVANDVRGLVAGGANANKTADQLVAEYDAGRGPQYRKAFSQPNAQAVWTPELEQMTQAPVVQNAIRMANITAKNEAAKIGITPMRESPFAFDPNGRMTLRTNPDGSTVTPNLQYWDTVKKSLDKMGTDGQAWSRTLRDHLDDIVPQYGQARGFAANFFGERDALEAGRTLAGKRVDPSTITAAMRKMEPNEQDLFREGYASDWANRVISNISDTRDITKAMFNSPNERARALAVFGPAGMAKIQARMTLETIMNGARQAMGNSTTARQLIEAGLAGGALEGYMSGWDPTRMAEGAAGAAGARKFLGSEMAAGARKLVGKVDSTTARTVARLLTSNDPNDLAQGMRMATKNQKIANGLKNIANRVALSSIAPQAGQGARQIAPMIQGAVGARADDKQPKP
jgi:Inorganic Pyrophosphatase